MKTHKVLFLALIVSAILAVSVEAGDRRGNNSRWQAAASRGRSSVQPFSSGSSFRSGGDRLESQLGHQARPFLDRAPLPFRVRFVVHLRFRVLPVVRLALLRLLPLRLLSVRVSLRIRLWIWVSVWLRIWI